LIQLTKGFAKAAAEAF